MEGATTGTEMRIILFTGKGGVGKTTLAAATALACARRGAKTLAISTDAAHSLSDSFEVELGDDPRPIAGNLFGQEVSAQEQVEKKWGEIKDYLTTFLNAQGLSEIEAEELSVLPGMEELFSLMEIRRYHRSGEYEVIIVDCAPTGDTLRLLSAPEATGWYLKHIFPIQRRAARIVRPVADRVLPFPFPEDAVFAAMKRVTEQLAEMKDILADRDTTSIRLVVNPEKMVIKEAQRAYTFFNLFGFNVDAVLLNRVLPPLVTDPYFERWKALHAGYRRLVEESFAPLPILPVELFDQEVVGPELLLRIAGAAYGDRDPAAIFRRKPAMVVTKTAGGFSLALDLPFVAKEDLDLSRNGEELQVRAGPLKRTILLPRALSGAAVRTAKFEGEKLVILFASASGAADRTKKKGR
jgi:arsenite-transporting ATPase